MTLPQALARVTISNWLKTGYNMQTFDEIAKDFSGTLLHGHHRDPNATGTLTVSGKDTLVRITSHQPARSYSNSQGFFSFSTTAENGRKIFLHNCINMGFQKSQIHSEKITETIFPNIVSVDAEALSKQNKVNLIVFSIDKFGDFFRYDFIESHSLYKAPKNILNKLMQIRSAADKINQYQDYVRTHDFFSPDMVYISHGPKKIISFTVDDARYEIVSAGSSGFGGNSLHLQTRFYARIYWSKLVNLDDALDAAWSWKRFFSQIASEELEPSKVGVRANGTSRRTVSASLYLPNLIGVSHRPNPWNFGPANVPFREWNERSKLSDLMQSWLLGEPDRRRFRVLLNGVISTMHTRYNLSDIVDLCAAVESISKGGISAYSEEAIEKVTLAAFKEAELLGLNVSVERITGLIKQLNQRSLPTRLKEIFSTISPLISSNEQRVLVRNILELRTIAAHGHVVTEMTIPKLSPTVIALASALIVFDQVASGLNVNDERLIAKTDLKMSIGAIMRLHAERKLA